jgi:hypothetical protein
VDATATRIYQRVEGHVQFSDCFKTTPTAACPTTSAPPTYAFGEGRYALAEKYKIVPEHAKTLASYLAEAVGGLKQSCLDGCNAFGCSDPALQADFATDNFNFGARDVKGTITALASGDVHLDPAVSFEPLQLTEIAPIYTRNASIRLPSALDVDSFPRYPDATWLGLDGSCTGAGCLTDTSEAKRVMGVLSAQAAVRSMVLSAFDLMEFAGGNVARKDDYFAFVQDMINTTGSLVGPTSLSIRPFLSDCQGCNAPQGTILPFDAVTVSSVFQVDGTAAADDTFFDLTCPGCTAEVFVAAVRDPRARTLAAQPTSSIFGSSLDALYDSASQRGDTGGVDQFASDVFGRRWTSLLFLKQSISDPGIHTDTFVARRLETPTSGPPRKTYRLLGSGVRLNLFFDRAGQEFATSGSMGDWVVRQATPSTSNPAAPAFDGFGLPTHWVPPFTAELLGGEAHQSSLDRYMALATEAAQNATAAVKTAIDSITSQALDDQKLDEARARSQASLQDERAQLCGSANFKCDTQGIFYFYGPVARQPDPPDLPINCSCATTDINCAIDKFICEQRSALHTGVWIPKPVFDHLQDPTVPSFSDFLGGDLQIAFIELWAALRAPVEKLEVLVRAGIATKAAVASAEAERQFLTAEQTANCDPKRMELAILEGRSLSLSSETVPLDQCPPNGQIKTYQPSAGRGQKPPPPQKYCLVGFDPVKGGKVSYDPDDRLNLGALAAQWDKCNSLTREQAVGDTRLTSAQAQAWVTLANSAVGVSDSMAAIQRASSRVLQLNNQAEIAKSRAALELKIAEQSTELSFGLRRTYRSYDLWRAKAIVENSRQYALAARRAIEARYVVDLSELERNEPFVTSPRIWADEIYGYDLALPKAVGLSTAPTAPAGTGMLFSNKIEDYVTNLKAFTAGYAAARPTAVAQNDIDVLSLPGPSPSAALDAQSLSPAGSKWFFHCPPSADSPGWTAAATGCHQAANVVQPDRVRLEFLLDAWGRLNGAIGAPGFERRFNGRWTSLAVNLVGTGVKDCKKAEDRNGCYSQAFVSYDLAHIGPAWITDSEEVWHVLDAPTGHIESGKALAAELWLDPLRDGWSTSFIAPVARTEFSFRPFGGTYELELVVPPELVLDRIERVQLLVGSNYWVRQK